MIRYIPLLVFLFVVAQILFFQPFFGLMDDHTYLGGVLPRIDREGLLPLVLEQFSPSSWGMVRPTLPIMVFLLYSVGEAAGPVALYLVNAVAVFSILYLNAHVFSRVLNQKISHILIVIFCFPYTYDLFQHPSLQEKLVQLFGAMLIWAANQKKPSIFAVMTFTALGFLTKASFCIYIAMAFLVILENRNTRNTILVLIFDFIGVYYLSWVASKGHYTTTFYSLEKVIPNLLGAKGLFYLIVCVLTGAVACKEFTGSHKGNFTRLIPFVGIAAFLAIFSPWMISAYLQSIVAPVLGIAVVQAGEDFERKFSRKKWILFPAALALVMAIVRPYSNFSRLGDISKIIQMGQSLEESGKKKIFVPCGEGALALNRFFELYSNSEVRAFETKHMGDPSGQVIFYDFAMCPWIDPQSIEHCVRNTLYQPFTPSGYRLMELDCSQEKK